MVDFMPQELRPKARDVMASGTMDFITMIRLGVGMIVAENFSKPSAKLRIPEQNLRKPVSILTESQQLSAVFLNFRESW
jgi:hypothetical protein